MAGFIVLADGRAYAASNWATDATIRAIAQSIADRPLEIWLLAQQSEQIGAGLTSVDLRELAPHLQPVMVAAIRDAFHRVNADGRFEQLAEGDAYWSGWVQLFGDLVEMLDRSEAGESPEQFNPHMRTLVPRRNNRVGPRWPEDDEG